MWLKDSEKVWKAARVTENYNGGGSKLQLELEDDATPYGQSQVKAWKGVG